jgi:hypothetical protein
MIKLPVNIEDKVELMISDLSFFIKSHDLCLMILLFIYCVDKNHKIRILIEIFTSVDKNAHNIFVFILEEKKIFLSLY